MIGRHVESGDVFDVETPQVVAVVRAREPSVGNKLSDKHHNGCMLQLPCPLWHSVTNKLSGVIDERAIPLIVTRQTEGMKIQDELPGNNAYIRTVVFMHSSAGSLHY